VVIHYLFAFYHFDIGLILMDDNVQHARPIFLIGVDVLEEGK